MRSLHSFALALLLAFLAVPQAIAGTFTYSSGTRYVYSPTATIAGLNVGSVAGNPSAPINGDIWYNSTTNALNARINGATVSLGAGGGSGSGDLLAANNLSDLANPATGLVNLTGEVVANTIFAGPDGGGNDNPSFRVLALGDLPSGTATETWVQSNFSGSNNLITLGTVTTGTWNGTAIGTAYGGTGLTALGTEGQVLATSAGSSMEWITVPLLGTAQTFTAQNTFSKLPAVPRTNLSAGTSLVIGTAYYDALSSNRTLTFSGTPAEGQSISLKLAVTNVPVLTIPSCKRAGETDAAITSLTLYPGVHTLTWTRINAEWVLNDSVGTLNKADATTAPTTGDDAGDGYSVGSVWLDLTNDKAYICMDATTTAAVWKQTGGSRTSAQLAADLSDETGTGSVVLSTNSQRALTTSPGGADDTYAGNTFSGLNNSGGVTQWDCVFLNSSSQWVLADANGSGTFPARGLAVSTVTTGNATTVIEDGVVRNDAWTWTPGGTVFLSTTAGGLTQTAPSTTGDKVQVIGYAIDADTLRVKISPDYGTAP